MPTTIPTPGASVRDQLAAMKAGWGWFVAVGAAFIILGLIALAHLMVSTVATALYVGALVLVGGIVQMMHAFRVQGWGRFFFWLLSGLLYVVAGGLIMYQPLFAAGVITLMIGVSLVIGGVFRIWAGIGSRPTPGWGFIVFAGAITFLLGLEIVAGWPVNSPFILGLFLGIDLIINGVMAAMFGFALRNKVA